MNNHEFNTLKALFGDSKKLSASFMKPNTTLAVAIGKKSYDTIHLYTGGTGTITRMTVSDDDIVKECVSFDTINEHDHVFGQECTVIPELSDADSLIKIAAVFPGTIKLGRPNQRFADSTSIYTLEDLVRLEANDEFSAQYIAAGFQETLLTSIKTQCTPDNQEAIISALFDVVDSTHTLPCPSHTTVYLMDYDSIDSLMKEIEPIIKADNESLFNLLLNYQAGGNLILENAQENLKHLQVKLTEECGTLTGIADQAIWSLNEVNKVVNIKPMRDTDDHEL